MDRSAKQTIKIIQFNYTNTTLKHLQMNKTHQRSGSRHRHLFNNLYYYRLIAKNIQNQCQWKYNSIPTG